MSRLLDDGRELRIEAYLDGTLDAAGADELARALRAGGEEAAAIRERLAFAGHLGQALDPIDAEAVVRSVAERLDAQGSTSAFVRAVDRALPPRPFRYRWWLPRTAAAAAVMALAIAGAWWAVHRPPAPIEECRIVAAGAGSTIVRDGATLAAAAGTAVMTEDLVATRGETSLRFADGTTLALSEDARLRVLPGAAGRRARLETGRLRAEVAPQPQGRPFLFETAAASVEVVGTSFTLAAGGRGMSIDLYRGAVRVSRHDDGRSLMLHAGERVLVAAGQPFAPYPTEGSSFGADETRLFPGSGLDGWTQQHGRWTNDLGVVRGAGIDGGKARLLSDRDYGDLDLRCRLRIQGARQAEIQVGTYNWFFSVPSHGDEWIDLRLTQRGEELRCTADGVELAREAGAGRAARRGALGFYVMGGGTLEIASALITAVP